MSGAIDEPIQGNPYLEAFAELGGIGPLRWEDVEREVELVKARRVYVVRYAWAIPNDAALEVLARLAPIVEVGAGGGYWAGMLRARGVDVLAYDRRPASLPWADRAWSTVERDGEGVAGEHPGRTLFLCWPPLGEPMAANALRAYRGRHVVYVGEGPGGCTADDSFHDLLCQHFELVEEVDIPQWPGIHDCLEVWRRR